MNISGVYIIKNVITQKCYVGSSFDVYRRWSRHKYELTKNSHHSQKLQNAYNKYGKQAFVFLLAESATTEKQMVKIEQKWIDALDAVQKGYNINPFAGMIGLLPKTAEHKRKIGQAHKGRKLSEESKDKIRQKALGRKIGPMSDEMKKKLSDAKKGWKMPEEGKEKLRQYRLGKKNGPMSEEHKKAISEGRKRYLSSLVLN